MRCARLGLAIVLLAPLSAMGVAGAGSVPLRSNKALGPDVPRWHFRTGVPFPKGALSNGQAVRLVDASGREIPVQTEALATWAPPGAPGASVKWLGVAFQAPIEAGKQASYRLEYGRPPSRPADGALRIEQNAKTIRIESEFLRLRVRRSGFNFIDELWARESRQAPFTQVVRSSEAAGPFVVKAPGVDFLASRDKTSNVRVEYQGPLAAVVRAEGRHLAPDGAESCRYVVRLYVYAALPFLRAQHTFIITEDTNAPGVRWRDIGLRVPVQGDAYLPAGTKDGLGAGRHRIGTVPRGGSAYLLQTSWDSFKLVERSARGAIRKAEGTRSSGWLAKPGCAVIVRDFWQNYPKEIEATRDALLVHFWPAHGEAKPNRPINADNAWRLWFAHEGSVLDFRVPGYPPDAEMYAKVQNKTIAEMNFRTEGLPPGPGTGYYKPELIKLPGYGPWKPPGRYQGISHTPLTNALGLAKTHDMLLVFGEASADRIESYARAFQEHPHVIADPRWVCASQAAGRLHARDPERFPWVEKRISLGFDSLMAQYDGVNNYGMFNYGDTHSAMTWDGKVRQYRLWNATHHGKPRVPWLLYLRSADPKYLDFGMANCRHIIDTDVCHHTVGDFARRAYQDQKRVGGLCDYKGKVHWNAGGRVGYNSMVDFALYDYYLTGNRRAWDVVVEMGECATKHGIGHPSRHGAGVLATLLEYYKATWDPKVWRKIRKEVPRNFSKPGHTQHPSCNWAPWLQRYIELTGDKALGLRTGPKATHQRAMAFLLEWANWISGKPDTGQNRGHSKGNSDIVALAYHLTGDAKYARAARALVEMRGDLTYENPRDRFSGWMGCQWYQWAYVTQYNVYGMAAAAAAKPGDTPYWDFSFGPEMTRRMREGEGRLVFHVYDADDEPIALRSRMAGYCEPRVTFFRPDGSTGAGRTSRAKERFEVDMPKDGQRGWYRIEAAGPKPFQLLVSGSLCSNPTLLYGIDPKSGLGLGHWGPCRFYFWAPEDAAKFAIHLKESRDMRLRCTAFVRNPDHEVVAAAMFPPQTLPPELAVKGAKPSRHVQRVIRVDVPPEHRGRMWSLSGATVTIAKVEGIPPYFAARPEGIRAMLKVPVP